MEHSMVSIVLFTALSTASGGLLSNLDYLGRLFYQTTLNCGCPCREVEVVNCQVLYETVCKPGYYDDCSKIPRVIEDRSLDYECQDCFSEYQTVTVPTTVKECYPVYDEKCSTSYIPRCSTTTECIHLYKTRCEISGYTQNCKKIPYERCTPLTKCHRTPKTTCKPIATKKCQNVASTRKERREFKKCYPYPEKNAPTSCDGFLDRQKTRTEEDTRQNIVAPSDSEFDYRHDEGEVSFQSDSYAIGPPLEQESLLPLSAETKNYALDRFQDTAELLPAAKNTILSQEFGPLTDGFRPISNKLLQQNYFNN